MGRRGNYVQEDSSLCLECGDSISEFSRTDKKFCCPECRNRYHYRGVRAAKLIRQRTGTRLERNHELLESLLNIGVTSIMRTEAMQMGLDPDYMTCCRLARGHLECSCYDISYRLTATRISNISKCLSNFDPGIKPQY